MRNREELILTVFPLKGDMLFCLHGKVTLAEQTALGKEKRK